MSGTSFSDRLRAEFEAVAGQLPAEVLPLDERREALRALAELGLPGLRDDAWRYANVRPLQSARFTPDPGDGARDATMGRMAALPGGAQRLVFVNGRLVREQSTLAGAFLPANAPPAARGGETRFALLNDIFATDAVRLRLEGAHSLELVFIGTGTGYPRVELQIAAGAQVDLVERHVADDGHGSTEVLVSAVTRLDIGRDAQVRYARLQDLPPTATHVEAVDACLHDGARLEAVVLHLGGSAVRSTIGCELAGRAAAVELNVVSLADDSRTLDTTLRVAHRAADTQSRQELRAIAADRSHVAFQSHVTMDNRSRGADSRQSLKGLIGGAGAEINLRPQLEIDVDSVRASHGATTGAIDETMLFYLLSRGIDRETARQLLEWAFVETVFARIPQPALRREFEERTVARLRNRAAIEVLS